MRELTLLILGVDGGLNSNLRHRVCSLVYPGLGTVDKVQTQSLALVVSHTSISLAFIPFLTSDITLNPAC